MRINFNGNFILGTSLAILSLFSCQFSKDQSKKLVISTTDAKYNIDVLGYGHKKIQLENFFDSVEFIKLETLSESLIGQVNDIFFDDGKIFIVDKSSNEGVYIFNTNGKFLCSINDIGKGPGEFIEIFDATINKITKEVCINDLAGRSVHFFDYDGNHKRTVKAPFLFSNFEWIDGDWLIAENTATNNRSLEFSGLYSILITNLEGTIRSKAFPYDLNYESVSYTNHKNFIRSNSELLYYPRFTDVLYEVKKDSIFPLYRFDCGEEGIPKIFWNQKITDVEFSTMVKQATFFNGGFFEAASFAIFKFYSNDEKLNGYLFYDKVSEELIPLNERPIYNRSDFFFNGPYYSGYENSIVTSISADQVLNVIETPVNGNSYIIGRNGNSEYVRLKPDLLSLEDNPILFIYRKK